MNRWKERSREPSSCMHETVVLAAGIHTPTEAVLRVNQRFSREIKIVEAGEDSVRYEGGIIQ